MNEKDINERFSSGPLITYNDFKEDSDLKMQKPLPKLSSKLAAESSSNHNNGDGKKEYIEYSTTNSYDQLVFKRSPPTDSFMGQEKQWRKIEVNPVNTYHPNSGLMTERNVPSLSAPGMQESQHNSRKDSKYLMNELSDVDMAADALATMQQQKMYVGDHMQDNLPSSSSTPWRQKNNDEKNYSRYHEQVAEPQIYSQYQSYQSDSAAHHHHSYENECMSSVNSKQPLETPKEHMYSQQRYFPQMPPLHQLQNGRIHRYDPDSQQYYHFKPGTYQDRFQSSGNNNDSSSEMHRDGTGYPKILSSLDYHQYSTSNNGNIHSNLPASSVTNGANSLSQETSNTIMNSNAIISAPFNIPPASFPLSNHGAVVYPRIFVPPNGGYHCNMIANQSNSVIGPPYCEREGGYYELGNGSFKNLASSIEGARRYSSSQSLSTLTLERRLHREPFFELDESLWEIIPRRTVCNATACVYRNNTTLFSHRKHYHALCDHLHQTGEKRGMPFHHHQLEKIKKHQRAHQVQALRNSRASSPVTSSSHPRGHDSCLTSSPTSPQSSPISRSMADLLPPIVNEKPWTPRENDRLRTLAEALGGEGWGEISRSMGGHRSELACRIRWGEMCETKARESRAGVGSWSAEEDEKLKSLVGVFGFKWAQICMYMPGRVGKQCRERYLNHLDPTLKKTPWTPEEDQLLLDLHQKLRNSWADIARQIPGRCDNDVKNRWNLIQRRTGLRACSAGSTAQQTDHEISHLQMITPPVSTPLDRLQPPTNPLISTPASPLSISNENSCISAEERSVFA